MPHLREHEFENGSDDERVAAPSFAPLASAASEGGRTSPRAHDAGAAQARPADPPRERACERPPREPARA